MKINWNEFETILPTANKREMCLVTVHKDGVIVFNSSFMKKISDDAKIEVRLSKNGKQLVILKGNESIKNPKSGRFVNFNVLDRMKKHKNSFPVFFIMQWNEEEKIWLGNISPFDPRSHKKKAE